MKIDKTGGTSGPSKSKKKDKSSGAGDASFKDMIAGGATSASSTAQSQAIGSVDALLAVQAADNPTEREARKRMQQRAHTILDQLEDIRMKLLTGQLTVGAVIDIASVVSAHRQRIQDPELTALLDEIDLRAQVEIAKMQMSMA